MEPSWCKDERKECRLNNRYYLDIAEKKFKGFISQYCTIGTFVLHDALDSAVEQFRDIPGISYGYTDVVESNSIDDICNRVYSILIGIFRDSIRRVGEYDYMVNCDAVPTLRPKSTAQTKRLENGDTSIEQDIHLYIIDEKGNEYDVFSFKVTIVFSNGVTINKEIDGKLVETKVKLESALKTAYSAIFTILKKYQDMCREWQINYIGYKMCDEICAEYRD